jgi:uncharacterized protein YrrD
MKKTQEIFGLPVISISDGIEVGKVKSIIINADKGAVDYIVVDSGIQILSARVIPTDNILGMGEYALTIENDAAINEISKIPAAIDLLQKNILVKGTKVLTKKGRLIGEIGDFFIDEDDSCKIVGLEYIADITQKRVRIIPRESVITFGKNLIVVTDDVENTLLDKPTELNQGDKSAEGEKKNLVNFETELSSETEIHPEQLDNFLNSIEPDRMDYQTEASIPGGGVTSRPVTLEAPFNGGGFPDSGSVDIPAPQSNTSAQGETSAAGLFEQKQRQYLNGRRVTKTLTDNSGHVIIHEGTVITDSAIDEAKSKGKLIELVMNNKA